jgi:uncharacterized Zn-finger protein
MLQHRKKHSEEIVYKCDHCGQEFSKTCALYYHIRQCTGGEDKQESTQAISSSNQELDAIHNETEFNTVSTTENVLEFSIVESATNQFEFNGVESTPEQLEFCIVDTPPNEMNYFVVTSVQK